MIFQTLRKLLQEAQDTCFETSLVASFRESGGVYSTALPLQLSKLQGVPPQLIADKLALTLAQNEDFKVWPTDPGFLNFEQTDASLLAYFKRFCENPLAPVKPPAPHGATLSELRNDLACQILEELGATPPRKIGEVTAKLTARDAIDRYGQEAVFFYLLSKPLQKNIDFQGVDIVSESLSNPWYNLCHSHVRLTAIARVATPPSVWEEAEALVALEKAVMREILSLPEACRSARLQFAPHVLSHYALKLAALFDELFSKKRVLSPEDRNDSMRLRLAFTSKDVLGHVLLRFGIVAPLEL